MMEIPQQCDFIIWSNQNFVRKVKQLVKKYYIRETFNSVNLWLRLYKKGNDWVRINGKNKKHFSGRFSIQVCELLQVLTEAAIERCFEK